MYEDTTGSRIGRYRTQSATTEAGALGIGPEGYRVVEVNTLSSGSLRDLASYRRDIEMAKSFIDTLLERGMASLRNMRQPDAALWIAAITMYGRAFKTGVRIERPSTQSFTEEEKKAHQYFLNLRDKHIAHAVNDYEQTIAVAYITDSAFAAPAVTRVGQTHVDLVPADQNQGRLLRALCDKLISDLNRRIGALHRQVAAELLEMGLPAVYALRDVTGPSPDPSNVTKRRK